MEDSDHGCGLESRYRPQVHQRLGKPQRRERQRHGCFRFLGVACRLQGPPWEIQQRGQLRAVLEFYGGR